MNLRKLALLVLAALCFATLVLYLLAARSRDEAGSRTKPASSESVAFSGMLDIRAMDDMRVGGRKIVLCGVSFAKPRAMEKLVRGEARYAFQGRQLNCIQVGGGTPCDGRVAASFGDSLVAQCFTEERLDVARELTARGYLCDRPAQSGGIYRSC